MRSLEHPAGLADYLTALWKRKWLIVGVTLGLMAVVAVINLFLPPVWRVEMILQPAKFLTFNPAGQGVDVLMSDPRQIATLINQGAYNASIVKDLKLGAGGFPRLRAEFLRDTRLVKVTATAGDRERAELVLRALFRRIQDSLDPKLRVEINAIDTEIKRNELQGELLTKGMGILDNKLGILRQREREILEEAKAARERISKLDEDQRAALRAAGREDLAQLIFSFVIQQSYEYMNRLDQELSENRGRAEDIVQRRRENEQAMEVLKNATGGLMDKKTRYEATEMLKEPTSSGAPISPQKSLNILLAGILGVLASGLAVLIWESFEKSKAGG